MNSIKKALTGLFLFPLLFITSCESNRFDVDTSNIEVDFQWKRLDKDFRALKNGDINEGHKELKREYGTFYERYVQNILRLGHASDPAIAHPIEDFLTDEHVGALYDTVFSVYPDVSEYEADLQKAFTYYRYHFPERNIPDAVSFMGGFNYNVAATDSALGIGMEYYLGSDREIYTQIGLPLYKVEKMDPEYMVYDAMRGWMISEFGDPKNEETLLAGILEYGKTLYAMDAVFPFAPDHLKIGYKKEEIEWCRKHDSQIWQHMMDSDMLFSRDKGGLKRFTGEAPFTAGMSKESPGQVGLWVGLQIVRQFMERHPDMTLPELMELNDHKRILSKSQYKPSK